MTIENVLSAYDIIGKKFSLSDIISELGKLSDAEKKRQEFQYEVTAFYKRNGFQLLILDELLRTKPIEDAFTSDGALYLRLVLTDQRSLNIRNLLCHGIVPSQYFNSGAAARLLHVLIIYHNHRLWNSINPL